MPVAPNFDIDIAGETLGFPNNIVVQIDDAQFITFTETKRIRTDSLDFGNFISYSPVFWGCDFDFGKKKNRMFLFPIWLADLA